VGEKLIEAAHDHVANCMINRELSAEEAVGMEVKVLLDRHHLAPGIIDSVGKEEGEKGNVFYMVTVAPSRESRKISRKEFVTEEDVSCRSLIYDVYMCVCGYLLCFVNNSPPLPLLVQKYS